MPGDGAPGPVQAAFKVKQARGKLGAADLYDGNQDNEQADGQGDRHDGVEFAEKRGAVHGQQRKQNDGCNASDSHRDAEQRMKQIGGQRDGGRHSHHAHEGGVDIKKHADGKPE